VSELAAHAIASDLLERDDERATLAGLLATAAAGDSALVVIEGPAGIGKTRLLADLRARAAEQAALILHARAGEFERDYAYGVVRSLFEPALARLGEAGREAAMGGPAALAAPVLDITAVGDEEASYRSLHGLYWLTLNLAARAPLVIVIDDAQWCDDASLHWLSYVCRRLDGVGCVIAIGLRDEGEAPGLLLELARDPARVAIAPRPLSEAAVALIVRQALPAADDEFCAACARGAHGNPLFVRELTAALVAAGIEPTAANVDGVEEISLETVGRAALDRLERLPAEAGRVARAVALLGDGAPPAQIGLLAEVSADALDVAVTRLREAGLLSRSELAYVSPLARAAVRQAAGLAERATAQTWAARRLVESGEGPERAAALLAALPPAADAFVFETLRAAGRAALARGAPEEAVGLLRRALVEPAPAGERVALLAELGSAERLVDPEAAAGHLAGALESTTAGEERARVGLVLARTLTSLGRLEAAVDVLERLLAETPADARALRQPLEAAYAYATLGRPGADEPALAAEIDDDQPGAATLLAAVALRACRRGEDRDRVMELARRALRALDGLGDERELIATTATAVLADGGHTSEALESAEALHARSARVGSLLGRAAALWMRGRAGLELGRLADAENDLRDAVEGATQYGFAVGRHGAAVVLADALLERGSLDEAGELLDVAVAEAPDERTRLRAFEVRARLRLAQGRAEEALADSAVCARRAEQFGLANPAQLAWRSTHALALHRLGQQPDAVAAAAGEVALARDWGAPHALARALRVNGLITGGADGIELLEQAVAAVDGAEHGLEATRCLLDLGAALRRAGRRSDGRAALSRALERAEAGGADALADRAVAELEASGTPTRRHELEGVAALTPSERRATELAALGATNREIAQTLFVTPKTVEVHLSRAFRKLGVAGRRDLAAALAG
jgi:DNA-binding CsgD family transcriptional regulator